MGRRANLGIFAMFVVDAWMCYSNAKKVEGDRYGLVKRNTSPYGCDLLAYGWMDQDHREVTDT